MLENRFLTVSRGRWFEKETAAALGAFFSLRDRVKLRVTARWIPRRASGSDKYLVAIRGVNS
jgi:hypothetical protein